MSFLIKVGTGPVFLKGEKMNISRFKKGQIVITMTDEEARRVLKSSPVQCEDEKKGEKKSKFSELIDGIRIMSH